MRALAELSALSLVALLATIGGLVGTWWISLRQNLANFRRDVGSLHGPMLWKMRRRFWAPYVIIVLCWGVVMVAAVWPRQGEIRRHLVQRISTPRASASINGCSQVDLYSDEEHFAVAVDGVFFGPELESLHARYGDLRNVRVYVIVAEESRPQKQGLFWVQANEAGPLGERGHYRARAFFGGRQEDSAREGDVFSFRIFVPDDMQVKFPPNAVYDSLKKMPTATFVSEPIYVRTLRVKSKP
jgi:hypothetical protein